MNSVVETSDTNVMVPFMLSISLVIRCPAEVHDQVGNTLRLLTSVSSSQGRTNAAAAGGTHEIAAGC